MPASSLGTWSVLIAALAAQVLVRPSIADCVGIMCPEVESLQLLQYTSSHVGSPESSGPGCPGPSCGAPGCPGFVKCPTEDDFPLPFKGSYPTSYPFQPGMHFPKGFKWGLGTASYQIEGAYNEDGRGVSIWDTFSGANTVGMPGSVCEQAPCPVSSAMGIKGATGNVANDFYHKYKQDIAMMASMGVQSYRFSVAWPRVVPTGVTSDGINQKAIAFYHDVIDELIAHGVEPIITMYHWDLPQGLQDMSWNSSIAACDSKYKQGWYECADGTVDNPQPSGMSALVVKEFTSYATLLLKEYGSKVKYWATFNEAWTFTFLASGGRGKAPNVQPWYDADVWPYVAGHNVIIAHAMAVSVFRQMQEKGELTKEHKVLITNNQDWREPLTTSPSDIAAAEYALEGQLAWYCDPIYGVKTEAGYEHDYPASMKMTLPYMPNFTMQEKQLLEANRPDVFGLNHYGTGWQSFNCTGSGTASSSCTTEDGLPMAVSSWLFQAPWGFRKLLNWIAKRYGRDLPIWGTESGWSDNTISALQAKYDTGRLMYYFGYIMEMWNAIHVDGVKMEAFMAWSLMDNYEWERGYAERFGCLYNEFQFGADPNSPSPESPVYVADQGVIDGVCGSSCEDANVGKPAPVGAYNQTRHAKNSILWLQWVWESNSMVDQSRFLASTIGGDVCYGEGEYNGVKCSLSSTIPGPAPPSAYSY
mmetsp:Transcript_2164/g.5334  ORF Transcript_2164/g.5334 Transcript_2164/m.5334 type:complete len:700 (+) Transcript_2164:88-2187(+)